MYTTLWNKIIAELSDVMSPVIIETWLKPLRVDAQSTSDTLVINAPNQFICDFVDLHYRQTICEQALKQNALIKNTFFVVNEKNTSNTAIEDSHISEIPGNTISTVSGHSSSKFIFNKNFTFDTFVTGPGNEFAKSAALAVAKAPGKTKFNPLLIYSGVGLGKTHLLHAIGNYLLKNSQNSIITYTSSEEFYLNFIDAIKNNNTKKFSQVFKSSNALLIDDVQFFSGKESTQEEFFHIFNTLYQNGQQIVLTTDVPPGQLTGLQDRIISRFQWGLSVDIQPPNLETRIAILKKKAEESNLSISEPILTYIAENIASNIRELEGIIIRLLAYASITQQDITIELVQTIIMEKTKKKISKISIDEIINAVADYYKVPVNNIREKNRRKEVAFCRQLAMYMAKIFTNFSLKSIGLHFGGRDHSTVIHAVQTIEKLKNSDPSIASDIDIITSVIKNS